MLLVEAMYDSISAANYLICNIIDRSIFNFEYIWVLPSNMDSTD